MNKELELNKLIKLYKESDFNLKQINEILKDHDETPKIEKHSERLHFSNEIEKHSERWWNRKHDARTDIINLLTDDEHFVDRYIRMNEFMKCFAKDINMKDTVKWFTNRENA